MNDNNNNNITNEVDKNTDKNNNLNTDGKKDMEWAHAIVGDGDDD